MIEVRTVLHPSVHGTAARLTDMNLQVVEEADLARSLPVWSPFVPRTGRTGLFFTADADATVADTALELGHAPDRTIPPCRAGCARSTSALEP